MPQNFKFDNAISIGRGPFIDIAAELPDSSSFGFANESLANGRLLLANRNFGLKNGTTICTINRHLARLRKPLIPFC